MQLLNDGNAAINGGFSSIATSVGISKMMGESDGFTLVKGISPYGLKK